MSDSTGDYIELMRSFTFKEIWVDYIFNGVTERQKYIYNVLTMKIKKAEVV